jgi:hypothetical protein
MQLWQPEEWALPLMKLWDLTAAIKAVGFATIVVILLRYLAFILKEKYETKEVKEAESGKTIEVVVKKKSIQYPIPDCPICCLPLFRESGLEFTRASTVQLSSCHHLFHRPCYLNSNPNPHPPCPTCFTPQLSLTNEPLHMWQTVAYWQWHINKALDQFGPRNFLSWATIRMRTKDLADLSVDILREGEAHSFGSDDCRDDEDLIGPGAFPLRKALADAGALRYEWNGKQYATPGNWITHKSSEGTEKEIWKVSWGSPPWAHCSGCGERVPSQSQVSCEHCRDISSERSYWCSEECKAKSSESHVKQCADLCQVWREYQEAVALRREEHENRIRGRGQH